LIAPLEYFLWLYKIICHHCSITLLLLFFRSESENHWFRRFTNPHLTLIEFYLQFESAIDWQRHIQRGLDFESSTKELSTKSTLQIEKHASSLYTLTIFKRVQLSIWEACIDLRLLSFKEVEDTRQYVIKDRNNSQHGVLLNVKDQKTTCTCRLFEREGLLCSHIFYAFKDCDFDRIPEMYICNRWTKDACLRPVYGDVNSDVLRVCAAQEERKMLINQLWADFHCVVELAGVSNECLVEVSESIKAQKEKLMESRIEPSHSSTKKRVIESFCGSSAPSEINVHPPAVSKNKGSGRRGRIKSVREKAIEDDKRPKRLCRSCQEYAHHDSRNCPMNKEA
jgi:hypothetical protein